MTKVIDGGLSTELQRIGARIDGSLWTGRALLEAPDLILAAHRNFIEAGAEVIITSSYQLSRRGFLEIGLTEADADAALVKSVEVAREAAAGNGTLVAASIGPYGATLHDGSEYRGNYGLSVDELEAFHRERIAVLAAARPDILAVETIPDLIETHALVAALANNELPVWFSFTAGSGDKLWSGASIRDAVHAIKNLKHLEAIGFNCVDPNLVIDLVAEVRAVADLRDVKLVVYANKGGAWDSAAGEWNYQHSKPIAEYWHDWQGLGLAYVGGCCGLDAPDIAVLAEAVKG